MDRSDHTTTTVREISENKLDCQVPEEEIQRVERSEQFAVSKSKGSTIEQLMERSKRLEEQSNEMYQRIQRLECGNATSVSGECRKEGVSPKGRAMKKTILGFVDGKIHGGFE